MWYHRSPGIEVGSSCNCKMGALLLILLPEILSPPRSLPGLSLCSHVPGSLPGPSLPKAGWSEPLHRAMNTSTVALSLVYQLGLSPHQTVRNPRARNSVQFSPALSMVPGPKRNSIHSANIHKAQGSTEDRTGSALEKLFPQKRTVNPPLPCSYPIKSSWNKV